MTCALLVAAAPASAAEHPFLGTFCEPTGVGTPPCDPTLSGASGPQGMAVDQSSGDLLVIGLGNVSRWHDDGTPSDFSALGTNVIDGAGSGPPCTPPSDQCDGTPEGFLTFAGASEAQVAVDNSGTATDGNIYVTQAQERLINIFSAEGEYLGQLTGFGAEPFSEETLGVAVDPDGNVYVSDFESGIHKFEPDGNPPVNADHTASFPFNAPSAVAAGEGAIFVAEYPNPDFGGEGKVFKLNSTTGASECQVGTGTANTTVSVDPATGNVYAAEGDEIKVYDASCGFVSSIEAGSDVQGVAVNEETGNVYVTRAGNSNVEVYGPSVEEFELTIDKTGTGTGTVTSTPPGINCGTECAASFEEGEEVQLEADAETGSEFTGWTAVTGDPGTCTGTTSPCDVTMSEAVELEAGFQPEVGNKALTINTSTGTGTGAVNCEVNGGPTVDQPCASIYQEGTDLKLIPVPGANSLFAGYNGGTGSISCTGTPTCEFTLDEDSTVNAVFNLEKRLLTVTKNGTGTGTVTSNPAGISCDPTCTHEFDHGTLVKLTGTPGANTQAVAWTGCSTVNGSNECEVTMSAAKGVTATFNLEKRLLTVTKNGTGTGTVTSSPAGISCGATCTHEFNLGTLVKLTGTPGANTQAVVWSGCAAVNGSNECEVTMSAAKGVTATFNLAQRTLTINKAGTGNGTFQCKTTGSFGACAASYPNGATITIKATPDSHSTFVSWSGCSSTVGNECTVSNISANTTVTGTFNLAQRTLTINKAGTGSGSVTCDGATCAASYADGTKVTLAASAASGSTFAGFSGGGCSGTGPCVVTMSADTTVTATFNANPVVDPPPPATCPADPSKCPPPSNVVKVGTAKQQGTAIVLKVTVPGPGTLVATGKNLVKAKRSAKAAGTTTLKLKLTSAGKKQLKKKGKLKIKVKIVFTPTGGTPGKTTKMVTFKSKAKR